MNNLASWFRNWTNRGVGFLKGNINRQVGKAVNPFANFNWKDTKWSGLSNVATGMIGNTAGEITNMNDRELGIQGDINSHGQRLFDNLTDNSSLLAAGVYPTMSEITDKDIRDKSWGQDISSSFINGLNAGLATGNPYIGIGVAVGDFGKDLLERMHASNTAESLERSRRFRNRLLGEQLYASAQNVDEENDFDRIMSYYMNPYDFAFGGQLHSNGGDYNGGLTYIDEGGSHEENPLEGVPSGISEDGSPNLVEEGEVIWNNEYVFSNRLKVPKELANKYKLGGKKSYTFAEAIEKLTKENTISPNDFITIATTKEIVNEFMDAQEALREQEQLAERERFEAAQAQNFLAQLDAAQSGGYPMGLPMNIGQMGMGMPNEAPVTEGEMVPPGYAFGGHKFDGGGWKDYFTTRIENGNVIYTSPDGIDFYSEAAAKKHYDLSGDNWIIPSGIIYNTSVGTGAEYSGSGTGSNERGEYSTRPESPVEPVYTADGRRFRGYRVKGQKTVYGTYEGAMAHVPNSQKQEQEKTSLEPRWALPSPDNFNSRVLRPEYDPYATLYLDYDFYNDLNYRAHDLFIPSSKTPFSEEGYTEFMEDNDWIDPRLAPRKTDSSKNGDDIVDGASSGTSQASVKPSGRALDSAGSSTGRMATPSGETINYRKDMSGKELESTKFYKDFLDYMKSNKDSELSTEWIEFIQNEIEKLGSNRKLKDFDDWYHLASDGDMGSVHEATAKAARYFSRPEKIDDDPVLPRWRRVPHPDIIDPATGRPTPFAHVETDENGMLTVSQFPHGMSIDRNGKIVYMPTGDLLKELPHRYSIKDIQEDIMRDAKASGLAPIKSKKSKSLEVKGGGETGQSGNNTGGGSGEGISGNVFDYYDTSGRDFPIYGSAMDYLYRKLNNPDYTNADRIIDAARRLGIPVNIPVETIGDYMPRRIADARYLVNMANQNRLAAARGIANIAGGNRSMDLLGNMSLAHSNQQELGEIDRQRFLSQLESDLKTGEFNRGTNIQNMGAINQRNLSQAQLNSSRQQGSLSGLTHGYGLRQTIRDNWDDAAMESFNSLLASVGARAKEREEYNILTSMAENGYFPWYYGDRSILRYIPQVGEKITAAKGGKLNRKKRRF